MDVIPFYLNRTSIPIPVSLPFLDSRSRFLIGINVTGDRPLASGSRTYVACAGTRVVGFCSLAASAVERRRVPSRVGRSMPEPVPVILLGQLAVDTDYQGRGLGSDLLVDAAKRALSATEFIGARAIVVQALDERAGRRPAVLA